MVKKTKTKGGFYSERACPWSVVLSVCGVRTGPTELMPVHPVLSRRQPAEWDEGLAQQQGVFPEGPVAQNPQVDDPLLQVALGDPFVHQLGEEVGLSTHFLFPVSMLPSSALN